MKRLKKIKHKANYHLKHFLIIDTIKKIQGRGRIPYLGSSVQQKGQGYFSAKNRDIYIYS
ncbi:hypothetical protein BpHYR1_029052 [Brachionus plicatilis]|uniref:Uncharacterized protein n=1 Tax=Brachionus plicatilis TaxID=10195 RepID=A0A3M7QJ89_BRAPC|nr:hypothetical protein BpHYR1_029052 [Brachionus plicatilis]